MICRFGGPTLSRVADVPVRRCGARIFAIKASKFCRTGGPAFTRT